MDVFQVVKALRVQNQELCRLWLVPDEVLCLVTTWPIIAALYVLSFTQTHFHTIFEAVLGYLDSFEAYSNFELGAP